MLYVLGCLIIGAGALLSCDDALRERAVQGDYFPLDSHSRWEYAIAHTYGCRCLDSGLVVRDTLRLRAADALFVDGMFFRLVDHHGSTIRMVRKLGDQYFESPAHSSEFMFLDPAAKVGASWIADEVTQTRLEVTAINTKKVINNISYDHVIEIKETNWSRHDHGSAEIYSTTCYYYAKDVGLIFSRRSFGVHGERSTIETTLLQYWKE